MLFIGMSSKPTAGLVGKTKEWVDFLPPQVYFRCSAMGTGMRLRRTDMNKG